MVVKLDAFPLKQDMFFHRGINKEAKIVQQTEAIAKALSSYSTDPLIF